MFLNSFSAYLWGDVAQSDIPPSRTRESKFEARSNPNQNDSQIQMQQRKKAQSQMRKVHIEMWRENVRRTKQLREGGEEKPKQLDEDDKVKRLHRIETLYMREISRQLKFGQQVQNGLQNSPEFTMQTEHDIEAPAISVDEIDDDYVLLVCPSYS